MDSRWVVCLDCGSSYRIAKSKRVQVCPNCAHKEKTGEYKVDAINRKNQELLRISREKSAEKQKLKPKQARSLPKFSKKGKRQALEVSAMKHEVKSEALDGEYIECEGCGNYFDTIDASHIIPLSQSSELAADKSNIRLFCRQCHNKWEHGTISDKIELRTFEFDMSYLLDMDPEKFWKLFHKLVDLYKDNPTQPIKKLIHTLETYAKN